MSPPFAFVGNVTGVSNCNFCPITWLETELVHWCNTHLEHPEVKVLSFFKELNSQADGRDVGWRIEQKMRMVSRWQYQWWGQVCLGREGREDGWEDGFFELHHKRLKPIQMQQQCNPRLTVMRPRETQEGCSAINQWGSVWFPFSLPQPFYWALKISA